jgi:hypothetical protein
VSVQQKPSGERSESANCYDTAHIHSETMVDFYVVLMLPRMQQ